MMALRVYILGAVIVLAAWLLVEEVQDFLDEEFCRYLFKHNVPAKEQAE